MCQKTRIEAIRKDRFQCCGAEPPIHAHEKATWHTADQGDA